MARISFLVFFYLSLVFFGFQSFLEPDNTGPHSTLVGFTFISFCVFDGRHRGKSIPMFSRWLLFSNFPLSLPIYFIWSRDRIGILWALLNFLGYFAAVAAGMFICFVVMKL